MKTGGLIVRYDFSRYAYPKRMCITVWSTAITGVLIMSNKSRVQFDVIKPQLERIDSLMKECGITSRKEYFDNALTLFEWAIEESKKGHTIATVDIQAANYNPVLLPVLIQIKRIHSSSPTQATHIDSQAKCNSVDGKCLSN